MIWETRREAETICVVSMPTYYSWHLKLLDAIWERMMRKVLLFALPWGSEAGKMGFSATHAWFTASTQVDCQRGVRLVVESIGGTYGRDGGTFQEH